MLTDAFNKKYNFNKSHLTISNDRFYYTIEFESNPLLSESIFTFQIDDFKQSDGQFRIKTTRSNLLEDLGLKTFTMKEDGKSKANLLYIDTLLNYEEVDYYDILESFLVELNFTKTKEQGESKVFTLGSYVIYILKSYVGIQLQKTEHKRIGINFYRNWDENGWSSPDTNSVYTDLNLFENIIDRIRYLWNY